MNLGFIRKPMPRSTLRAESFHTTSSESGLHRGTEGRSSIGKVTTPDNLLRLHQHEESIRFQALLAIDGDAALSDHLQAVHDALDHLFILAKVPSEPSSDLHTLQLFALRLLNVGASALKLGLSGYYQQAFQLLRDSLEMVNLVDLFGTNRALIAEWRVADNKKLKKVFGPTAVRSALDQSPQFKGQKAARERIYGLFSEHAAHVTYRGFNLLAPGSAPQVGCFFDVFVLQALLQDMGRHLAHATLAVSILIDKDLSLSTLQAKAAYLDALRRYHDRYIKAA
jgi:hypothetical protein